MIQQITFNILKKCARLRTLIVLGIGKGDDSFAGQRHYTVMLNALKVLKIRTFRVGCHSQRITMPGATDYLVQAFGENGNFKNLCIRLSNAIQLERWLDFLANDANRALVRRLSRLEIHIDVTYEFTFPYDERYRLSPADRQMLGKVLEKLPSDAVFSAHIRCNGRNEMMLVDEQLSRQLRYWLKVSDETLRTIRLICDRSCQGASFAKILNRNANEVTKRIIVEKLNESTVRFCMRNGTVLLYAREFLDCD